MDLSLSIGCPGHRQALPLHACVEYPQDKVEDAMIAEFALRSAPGRREVREDKCDELRLGELNGNQRRSWAFCHIAHRKWVDVKPERSSPESLTIAYNTKGYGTRKTRNHLICIVRTWRDRAYARFLGGLTQENSDQSRLALGPRPTRA